jgi:hypothetical protein
MNQKAPRSVCGIDMAAWQIGASIVAMENVVELILGTYIKIHTSVNTQTKNPLDAEFLL